jgi:hypothetical protein
MVHLKRKFNVKMLIIALYLSLCSNLLIIYKYKALAEVFCFSESDKSWEDAAQTAVKEAVKIIRNVHVIEVLDI